ncbi:hypothetical protein J2R99_003355 [Rhodopseudomonas julia]|uniref:Uncharacterized protein n=1 Tax=Rhodopseudomonas julia TaxID=200617 RepID=A0ABU0CC14_9BRAD|nr:hypothetical protein [Rhodopseudomonas julia]MDQ0327486.1 hypothetical protein [Rhodopseudomonas julia]
MRMNRLFLALGAVLGACLAQPQAHAADLARGYDAGVYAVAPAQPTSCDQPAVLNRIMERFAWAEKNTWHRGLLIDNVVEPRLRYTDGTAPGRIMNDRCEARALMSDGTMRSVYYIVQENMGFASLGRGIDFCVLGLDPWRVYDAGCSTMR